jgi:hypothetical protein
MALVRGLTVHLSLLARGTARFDVQVQRLGRIAVGLLSAWMLAAACLCAGEAHAQVAQVAKAAPALACAVEGTERGVRASELCRALGRELGRSTTLVDDARTTKHGEAIQIIHGDVQWVVAWLANGHVRAWTRVSKIEADEDQLRFLVRAARELAKVSPALQRECVQLDPNGGQKMRSPDLTYPWAELKPCRRRSIEVVDPWWLPNTTTGEPTAS